VAGAEAYLRAKFHLVPPTVRAQYTNVTDRQDKQQTDCIERTVLQMVTQKWGWFTGLG